MENLVGTNKKILIICEGSFEVELLKKIIDLYPLDIECSFYEYRTNIHILKTTLLDYFDEKDFDISDIDIIQVLKEHRNEDILNSRFTDILLVFDFEPQDARFDVQFLIKLQEYFCDSTNQGQLYLNYPMSESIFDFASLPDDDFNQRRVHKDNIVRSQYKNKVMRTSCIRDINNINLNNIRLILWHIFVKIGFITDKITPDYLMLLNIECSHLSGDKMIDVINTCALFLYDYNPSEFKEFIRIQFT